MLVLLFAFVVLFLFYFRKAILSYFRFLWCSFQLPTAPGAQPLIGHGLKVLGNNKELFNFLKEVSRHALENNGISTVWIGPYPCFVITDPDAYKKIANVCLDKNYKYLNKFIGGGIFMAEGAVWKQRVKVLRPAFTTKCTNDYLSVFNEHCKPLLKEFEAQVGQGPFAHRPNITYATIRMIFHATFGMTLEEVNITPKEYKENFFQVEDITMKRLKQPWLQYDFIYQITKEMKKETKSLNVLHEVSMKVLKKAKEDYAKKKEGLDVMMPPYLENLLRHAETGAITDKEIRGELNTIIITGFESITVTIAINLLLLGAHPETQDKVYEELYEIFGDSDRDVRTDDLERMVYLDAAIKESSRCHPFAPFTGRVLDRDMQFKDYKLPAGTTVFASHWGMNRRPFWGDDVEEFKPERWLKKEGTIPDYTFGVGIRSCIGKTYAIVAMKAILSHILRRYKIISNSKNIKMELAISIQPTGGFDIGVEPRRAMTDFSDSARQISFSS